METFVEQVSKQVLESIVPQVKQMAENIVPQLEEFKDRVQRLEDRYQQLGGATDEHIEEVIIDYLNDSDHFSRRIYGLIEDWAEKNEDDTPAGQIKRVVCDMINDGDIVVSLDTM